MSVDKTTVDFVKAKEERMKVLKALRECPDDAEGLAITTGVPIGKVVSVLDDLEKLGLVE